MRGIVAIARREIFERRIAFLAAALLGLLPFLAPLLPAVRHYGAGDVRLFAAVFFAIVFAGAQSLILGGSTIGRDLSERRLGFYFARPVSAGAIWAGKFLGIWLMVLSGAAIILFPVSILDFRRWAASAGVTPRWGEMALLFAGAVILCLGLGNLIGTVLRARSAWLAGDIALLAIFAFAVSRSVAPLVTAEAPRLLEYVLIGLSTAIAIALLASGFAQVAIGRTDAARGNRARFAVLWLLLFAAAGLCAAYVRWVFSPSPADLFSASLPVAAPSGTWIELSGYARGRADFRAALLYDVATGNYARALSGRGAMAFSGDGRAAAWAERSGFDSRAPLDIWICRLEAGPIRRVRTPLSARVWNIAMSPEGSRVALVESKTVSVFEVPSGRLVASAAVDSEKNYHRVVFLGKERLRLYRLWPGGPASPLNSPAFGAIGVLDFDLAARTLREIASIENIRRPYSLAFDDRGERLIALEQEGSVSLFDVSNGWRLATLSSSGRDVGSKGFLFDGRPMFSETKGGIGRVHVFERNGGEEKVFEVGPASLVRLGAEPAAGRLALGFGPGPQVAGFSDASVLDLENGSLFRLRSHLSPVAAQMRWRIPQPQPGSAISRLFSRNDGGLVLLDPSTNTLKTLFPGH
jgi:hypothetical protein